MTERSASRWRHDLPIRRLLSRPFTPRGVVVEGWCARSGTKGVAFWPSTTLVLANLRLWSMRRPAVPDCLNLVLAPVSGAGPLIESPGVGQRWEVQAAELRRPRPGRCSYPLQKSAMAGVCGNRPPAPPTNSSGAMFRWQPAAFAVPASSRSAVLSASHADLHHQRLRGAGEMFRVPPRSFGTGRDARPLREDFFARAGYRQRPAAGSCSPWRSPTSTRFGDLPCETPIPAPRRRVLDDRTGDGFADLDADAPWPKSFPLPGSCALTEWPEDLEF